MSRSGGMSQLLKGIIIGIVLIMAIIGTMSMLDKNDSSDSVIPATNNTLPGNNQNTGEIEAPEITLNPNTSQSNNTDNSNIGDLNADIPSEEPPVVTAENNIQNEEVDIQDNSEKPVLEGEKTAEERAKELNPIDYGMMELSAINPADNQALKANYVVYDNNNKKIAESTDASNAAYKLPVGQYKVETTLTRIDEATSKVIPVVTKSRYMIIRANSTAKQTFELEPPNNTGVLQVSAKLNEQVIRANFVVQKQNGEVVASRNNVSNSLFKLDTGTYKVSVSSGENKDFRSVEVKAGESIQTVFILKEAIQQGKLLVRIFDTKSSNPIRANITISSADGKVIQDLTESTQTELTLAAGNYKIQVVGPNGTSNKNIRINAGQALNEIFRFDAPSDDVNISENNPQTSSQNSGTKITDNVTIKPVETQTETTVDDTDTPEPIIVENNKAQLRVIALDERTRKPIKSNIYIQTPAGKHLDKKTYVDAATFDLLPGSYKVTVRANNRNNLVKTIRITENQNLSETFLLINPNAVNRQQDTTAATNTPEVSPPIRNNTATIPTGFLNVSMQPPRGQNVNKNQLKTHFIVTSAKGIKIVELTSVNAGNFKLDAGSYNVTAIYKNKRRNQRITVKPNKNTRLMFYASDFQPAQVAQAAKGILKSRIVDETGRPLKGNLSVSNMTGQIVARANGVSDATFNLPSARHTVSVNFQGLSGNEAVNIIANETTIQTFTIAPNRAQNNNSQNSNDSRDFKDILRDKLKEELRKTF